jgi:hypothetical protein
VSDEAQETRPKVSRKGIGGRPSKFKPEMVEQAKRLCMLGATDREVADFFHVSESTLNLWKLEHPEFSESLKLGKEASDERVEKSLYRRALGYSHEAVKIFADPKTGAEQIVPFTEHYPPDTTAAIFWLKNRKPQEWRDRVQTELTGKDGGPIETADVSEAELARRVAFTLAQGLQPQKPN